MAMHVADGPFAGLERRLRERVDYALVRRTFDKGEHLYAAGNEYAGLFWLRSGVALAYNRRGDRYEFAVPLHWGLWGAPSIITRKHNSALEARTRCVVDWLPPEATRALMEEAAFVRLVAKWTADDYAMLLDMLAVMSIGRSEDRLLGYLTRIHTFAVTNPDAMAGAQSGSGIAWPFTTVQLAAFLGLSRPHLSAILGRLNGDGRVRIADRQLYMPEPQRWEGNALDGEAGAGDQSRP